MMPSLRPVTAAAVFVGANTNDRPDAESDQVGHDKRLNLGPTKSRLD